MDNEALIQTLENRKKTHLYRIRDCRESPQGTHIKIAGNPYLNFCSNNYLGLAAHPKLIQTFQDSVQVHGMGSGASNLITGYSHAHKLLEDALADWTGREAALLFSSGYLANLGVMTALMNEKGMVFQDRLNHASLLDAGLLCRARFQRYPHLNQSHLIHQLTNCSKKNKLIATESIFSMNGDQSSLSDLAMIAQTHQATLMVDDAHGIGILGPQGSGSIADQGLSAAEVPILVGTFGKAFGTFGAFVAGSRILIDTLIQYARSYIYTTASPPAIAATTLASLKLIQSESWRREKLQANIQYFKQQSQTLPFEIMPSNTPIQPLLIGEAETALKVADCLKSQAILVQAIRPPTVPENSSRLRITLSTDHTTLEIDQLIKALQTISKQVTKQHHSKNQYSHDN